FGYVVDQQAGTFTDQASGVMIRQSCVPAEPFYENPVHPFSGAGPSLVQSPWTIGVCTEVLLTLGQSNGGNFGRGRYTAGAYTWAYAGGGTSFQLSDPVAGQGGTDASPWPRLADLMLGGPHINPACPAAINRVIVAARNIGGTCIAEYAPGGDLNHYL